MKSTRARVLPATQRVLQPESILLSGHELPRSYILCTPYNGLLLLTLVIAEVPSVLEYMPDASRLRNCSTQSFGAISKITLIEATASARPGVRRQF
jgi:hypothetical protein